MERGRKCNCLFATLAVFITILLITYVSGYTMGNWTATTWLAVVGIVVMAVFCIWCRQEENAEDDK